MNLIFDTNSVRLLAPEGATADLLRIIKTSGKARVSVPEIVLQEMIAQQVIEYKEARSTAETAVRRLRGRYPEGFLDSAFRFSADSRILDYREAWERVYRQIFDVIPTSGEVALKALIREANGEKPAKLGGKPGERKKEGARDVAIWLSVVEYMRSNPSEQICFVSNNSKDFGDGTAWPPPMDQDIHGMEDRITLLADMNAVIDRFAERVQGQELSASARTTLAGQAPIIREQAFLKVRGPSQAASVLLRSEERQGVPGRTAIRRWITPPKAELIGVSNVVGHAIGDDIWFTASTKWLLWGFATTWKPAEGILPLVLFWQTRLLVSTSGERPTILSRRPMTERLTEENREEWELRIDQIYDALDSELEENDGQETNEQPTDTPTLKVEELIRELERLQNKTDGS